MNIISEITGGDACYGQPVNILGILLSILFLLIMWEIFKWSWRTR